MRTQVSGTIAAEYRGYHVEHFLPAGASGALVVLAVRLTPLPLRVMPPLLAVVLLLGGACLPAAEPPTGSVASAPADAATAAPIPAIGVIDLQRFRQVTRGRAPASSDSTTAVLTDLNPVMHSWYLLEIHGPDGALRSYHLELPGASGRRLLLDAVDGSHLLITGVGGDSHCDLSGSENLLVAARRALPYVPLCAGQLYLRRRVQGAETTLETAVEFLRDRVWGGETLVDVVKQHMVAAAMETAEVSTMAVTTAAADGPPPARVAAEFVASGIEPGKLGVSIDSAPSAPLLTGRWYPARAGRGIFVSVIEPGAIASDILSAHTANANPLDAVERQATAYLVAFDLRRFELGFVMGTDHPRVDWSPRPSRNSAVASWPGPDGFATLAPLAMTGMVPPWQASRTVATFAAGFKRQHGGFKYGDLARINNGSHYGFLQDGVVLSTLQPGLATLYVLVDGSVHMGTWSERDNRKLELVRYARQNGVALVERDGKTGESVPGILVNRWGPGNWSGSSESVLRSLRAGLCLATHGPQPMLIYAYFSAATPSAMARVFQAYDCDYAMLLDMNALVHTYFALYRQDQQQMTIEHLVKGMADADQMVRGRRVPRFLASPDNRDFFYLARRVPAAAEH